MTFFCAIQTVILKAVLPKYHKSGPYNLSTILQVI